MSCALLSLPGELRNRIFEFTLSEDDGLDYVEDSHGLGWLCLPKSQKVAEGSQPRLANGQAIANQLQFVCRQLRCETSTLVIRYNTIRFSGQDILAVSRFLNGLSVDLHGTIRDIIVWPTLLRGQAWMPSSIIEFCRKQPKCTLRYRNPMISSSNAVCLIFSVFMIKHEVRGDRTFVQKMSHDPQMQARLLHSLQHKMTTTPIVVSPTNLIYYPFDDNFDSEAFTRSCHQHIITRAVLIPTLTNGVNDLIALAKDCYENGF